MRPRRARRPASHSFREGEAGLPCPEQRWPWTSGSRQSWRGKPATNKAVRNKGVNFSEERAAVNPLEQPHPFAITGLKQLLGQPLEAFLRPEERECMNIRRKGSWPEEWQDPLGGPWEGLSS